MTGAIDPAKKLPHTAARDIATAATAFLLDESWTGQDDVPVLGPEELSYTDLATIISNVIDRDVHYEQVSFDALTSQLRAAGMNSDFVQAYADMLRAKDEGMDNVAPRASAIIGATSFYQWVDSDLKPLLVAPV